MSTDLFSKTVCSAHTERKQGRGKYRLIPALIAWAGIANSVVAANLSPQSPITPQLMCLNSANDIKFGNARFLLTLTKVNDEIHLSSIQSKATKSTSEENLKINGPIISADQENKTQTYRIQDISKCEYLDYDQQPTNTANATSVRLVLTGVLGSLRINTTLQASKNEPLIQLSHTLVADTDVTLSKIKLLDLDIPDTEIIGTSQGVPARSKRYILMVEHPMAELSYTNGHLTGLIRRVVPIRKQTPVKYSAAILDSAGNSPRRAFLNYIDHHRAHTYHSFLHYNSWYDIGYFTRYTEQDALDAIKAIGEPLKKRHVQLDSFLFDDGWDDPQHLWEFNSQFPNGFTTLKAASAQYGGQPGIWLSPWGGYGHPRQQRLSAAKEAGLEIDTQGLALSGPRYYKLFHDRLVDLVTNQGINHLKLDGTGSPDKVTPSSEFDSDFAAAQSLIRDLRDVKPDLYVNLTTGTWPSPFWLLDVDSIWRGGEDHSFLGEGSDRQRWITYRDADTYGGIVRISPWYPLNALMLHGIIFAQHAKGLDHATDIDFEDEVWSYFASGTGLQELYISGRLLSEHQWDILATAAIWAKQHASALRDSHWIGGDPALGSIYGHAGFSDDWGYIQLRNPSAHSQSITISPSEALDIEAHTPCLQVRSIPTQNQSTLNLDRLSWHKTTDRKITINLKPYDVQIWEWQYCH